MDWKLGVYSDGSKSFLSNPNPKKGEEVVIKIRFFEWDKLEAVFLRVKYNWG